MYRRLDLIQQLYTATPTWKVVPRIACVLLLEVSWVHAGRALKHILSGIPAGSRPDVLIPNCLGVDRARKIGNPNETTKLSSSQPILPSISQVHDEPRIPSLSDQQNSTIHNGPSGQQERYMMLLDP